MHKDRALTVIICTAAIIFAIVFKTAPVIYYKQGKNCLQKQDYINAYRKLKKAYLLNNKNKDYKYYYVQALTKLSPTLTVQKEVFHITEKRENDSAEQLASDKISEWRSNITYNIGDNYIEQASSDKGIIRWDKKSFPLKVLIEESDNVPSYYGAQIRTALQQWQLTENFIKFKVAAKEKDADIIIKLAPTPSNVCDGDVCRYIAGYTVPKIKGSILKQMVIILYTTDPQGNFFSDKEIYNTALHEIGHSLGIMGHSYSSADLMYMGGKFYTPNKTSFLYLSAKDINTIKLLYKLIPDITNISKEKFDTKGLIYAPIVLGNSEQISIRKLKEAQNYVKNAPEIAGGYIDLGIAYSELGKKRDAAKSFHKALELSRTDNDKYIAYFNLALIYFENKSYDKAGEYARMAQNISNSEEIKELIMNINHQLNKT